MTQECSCDEQVLLESSASTRIQYSKAMLLSHEYVDRFNRSFEIQKGVNRISIPLSEISEAPQGRAMDMKHIQSLALFSAQPEKGFSLYFDNLRLE